MDTIIGQTEPDWELLAVDDFSTDGSFDILKKYAAAEPRIKIFKNNKKGIAPALRMAYEKSAGRFITRMDSDDIMMPEKLFFLKNNLMNKGPGHIATGLVEYFSEDGVGEGYRRYADWLNGLTKKGDNFFEIYKECSVPSPCWMCYKDDLEKCGAFKEEIYPEDYDLVFRWRQAGFRIIPSGEVLHRWRDHPRRTSRTSEIYRDNSYFELKVNWFLKTDYNPARPLVLWGAGRKGKRIARLLNEKNISFGWVTNNKEKTGREIRGVELRHFNILKKLKTPQIIIAVASPRDQVFIKKYLANIQLKPAEDFYFYC